MSRTVEVRAPGAAPVRLSVDARLLVGRMVDGLVLVDERCSRTHCVLRLDGDALVVEDLGSTNGTFVNGTRIEAPTTAGAGDEIVVGSTRIVVDPDHAILRVSAGLDGEPDTDATLGRLRASVVGGTVTIVFTDIADSTAIGSALGDRRWFAVLERHDAVVRRLLLEFSGAEIKHQGDGFMLSFPSARQAVHFGAALQRELGRRRERSEEFPVRVRVGIHTGEVIRVDGDLFGRHVNIAARVAGAAAADEVLVSRLVHDIVSVMGDLEFGPPREVALKGLNGAYLLFPLVSG